jgi:hypothetical protein
MDVAELTAPEFTYELEWNTSLPSMLIAAPIGLTIAALRAVPFGTHSHIAARL